VESLGPNQGYIQKRSQVWAHLQQAS
jgi:hypothetical protein